MRISDWSSDVCSSDLDEPDAIGEEIVAIFGGDRHTEAGAPRPAAPFIADAAVELELAELHRGEQIDSIIVDFAALAAGVSEVDRPVIDVAALGEAIRTVGADAELDWVGGGPQRKSGTEAGR